MYIIANNLQKSVIVILLNFFMIVRKINKIYLYFWDISGSAWRNRLESTIYSIAKNIQKSVIVILLKIFMIVSQINIIYF